MAGGVDPRIMEFAAKAYGVNSPQGMNTLSNFLSGNGVMLNELSRRAGITQPIGENAGETSPYVNPEESALLRALNASMMDAQPAQPASAPLPPRRPRVPTPPMRNLAQEEATSSALRDRMPPNETTTPTQVAESQGAEGSAHSNWPALIAAVLGGAGYLAARRFGRGTPGAGTVDATPTGAPNNVPAQSAERLSGDPGAMRTMQLPDEVNDPSAMDDFLAAMGKHHFNRGNRALPAPQKKIADNSGESDSGGERKSASSDDGEQKRVARDPEPKQIEKKEPVRYREKRTDNGDGTQHDEPKTRESSGNQAPQTDNAGRPTGNVDKMIDKTMEEPQAKPRQRVKAKTRPRVRVPTR